MAHYLKDSVVLIVIIGCSSVFILLLFIALCLLFFRRRTKHNSSYKDFKQLYASPVKEKSIPGDDSLLFIFDTSIERQQSPVFFYQGSCPNSPGEYSDTGLKKSASNIDLVQPRLYNMIDTSELDLKMYQDEIAEASVSPSSALGKITLSLSYNKQDEILNVLVLKGENLQSKNSNSSSLSPYLKVCLLPDKKRRMHSKSRKGNNPNFEEEFSFSLPECELQKRILRIVVCDFDRFSRQNVLGYIILPINDVIETILSDERGTGEICKELSDNAMPPGLQKGELLFAISHLPTAGRLTLAIVKAKELNINPAKSVGISVKVNLIMNGKVIKSKKTSTNKTQPTSPVFNESFVFEISNEVLDRISFVVIVYACSNNSKRIIGKANTGPYMYSTGTGLSQWNEMLLQPRKSIAHWHTLV